MACTADTDMKYCLCIFRLEKRLKVFEHRTQAILFSTCTAWCALTSAMLKYWNYLSHFFQYLPHKFLARDWQVDTYNKEGRWKLQVSNSKSIDILLFVDDILKQIDVSHCLVKILSLKCLKSFVFIREIFKDHLWCTTWTCKNLKS